MARLFVTGTDTGVGKTVVSAALLSAISASGGRVRAHKPVVTGLEEPGSWPADHELLGSVAGMRPDEVAPLRYGPAVSPHLAAQLAHAEPTYSAMLTRARAAAARSGKLGATLVIEGVGGLLTPLTANETVRDLAAALGLPLLLAARPGLGTINHTLLTLEAARNAGLSVRAVVLTPWPRDPSALERSNRTTIASRGEVEVATLPCVRDCGKQELARAGAALPWRRWTREQLDHAGAGASGGLRRRAAAPEPARAAATTAVATLATSSSSMT